MVSDQDRRELFAALERSLGEGPANVMMELLPPVGWADVARRSDLVAIRGEMAQLRGELKGEMAGLRGEIGDLRIELKTEIAGLRTELKDEIAGLRTELKDEIAELRGRVDTLLPRLITANIASSIGVAALVLAAARLA